MLGNTFQIENTVLNENEDEMIKTNIPLLPVVIGTGFGVGYWPWGPGTAGALLATAIWCGMSLLLTSSGCLLAATVSLILVFQCMGIWSANRLEECWGDDPKRVVVDEMVGVWIALLAVPHVGHPGVEPYVGFSFMAAAFVLFRFFDIVKPFGVRHMEKMGGGVGVMMDDVLAGMYSFFVIYIFRQVLIL